MSLEVERGRSGREPFVLVELYMPRCTRTFGVAPCTGTGEPCYNTLASCKSEAAYAESDVVYRFCSVRNPVPYALEGAIPCVASIEQTPARVDANGGVGQRGVVTLTFSDTTHNDVGFDPSVALRTYDPLTRGTLFGKFRARHPYYNGRKVVVRVGYLTAAGEYDPSNFRAYTYFVDTFEGPDRRGQFRIVAKDLLKQIDDKRAQCPPPSLGKVKNAINNTVTSLTLNPAGIGNAEYPASGVVKVGSELMSFTRSGDVLTVGRAQYSTEASDHDADEAVQLCKVFTAKTVQNLVYELLVTYARVPAAYIPKAEWDQEALDYLPRLYSAVIASPTGVKQLVNELLEQSGTLLWWDEEAALLRFKSIRALDTDVVTSLGEWSHLLQDSLDVREEPNARLTQVWVYHGLIDPTKDLSEPSNYRLLHIETDPDAETARMYGDKRVKTIYSRWMTATNSVAAQDIAQKTLARFRKTPRRAVFGLDEKDGALKPGDFVQVSSRNVQKFDGSSEALNLQILSRKFKKLATHTEYEGIEFLYLTPQTGPSGSLERLIVISAPFDVTQEPSFNGPVLGANPLALYGPNLRAVHDSIYADLNPGDVVRFRILNGAGFYSSALPLFSNGPGTNGTAVVSTGPWPAGVTVYIDFETGSFCNGIPGRGAMFAIASRTKKPAQEGSPALYIDTSLNNATCFVKADGKVIGGAGGGAALLVGATPTTMPVGTKCFAGGGGSVWLGNGAAGGNGWVRTGAGATDFAYVNGWPQPGETAIRAAAYVGESLPLTRDTPGPVPGATAWYYGGGEARTDFLNIMGPSPQFLRYVNTDGSGSALQGGRGGYPKSTRVGGRWPEINIVRQVDIFTGGIVQTFTVNADGYYSQRVGDGPTFANVYYEVAAPGAAGAAIVGSTRCTLTGTNAAALVAGNFGALVP